MSLLDYTAVELAAKIKAGETTATEAMEAVIAQIEKSEDELNCYVTFDKEKALAAAKKADEDIKAGKLTGPLAGVPFAIKDNMCTEGMLTTCSSKILGNFVPTYTADAVVRLENAGAVIIRASNGKEAVEAFAKSGVGEVNVILMDIMMPVMDGITMVLKLRENYDFPVIFLSAKSEDIDKITGLNIGGDDYITKPFEAMELIARVNSNLRRYNQILALKENRNLNNNQQRLVVGGLELDKFTKEVFVNDRGVRLTAKEFQILELLMSYPGRVYSAEEIYEAVWKEEAINTETIMVHVRKLREKIEANPKKPEYLKVVWGIGYKIEKGV